MPNWSRREIVESALLGTGAACAAMPLLAGVPAADSLETLAHAKGLHFGTALGGRGLNDPRNLELIRAQCGVIVPENELKMPVIQPAPGDFHFERAEALLSFAESNGLAMRGHCLLW